MNARAIPVLALTVAEAAAACGCSEETMRQMIYAKRIKAVPFGAAGKRGELRVGVREIERYLLEGEGQEA